MKKISIWEKFYLAACGLVVRSIYAIVGKPRFDFLVKLYQKTLKVGIHSFLAWRSALRG